MIKNQVKVFQDIKHIKDHAAEIDQKIDEESRIEEVQEIQQITKTENGAGVKGFHTRQRNSGNRQSKLVRQSKVDHR